MRKMKIMNTKRKMKIMNTKAQSWSMDMILGVIIFLSLAIVFLGLLITSTSEFTLRGEAENIYSRLDARTNPGGLTIFDGNTVSRSALEELAGEDYEEVKAELGVKGDFCIVVVDQDGGLIEISDEGKRSFGNEDHDLEIAPGIICGT